MELESQAPTPTAEVPGAGARSKIYPWVVFALILGLMMSDYMSRQVLSSVFPVLKAEWDLSDSQLAALTSVVALMVGVLALPMSLVADRWGRVRSVVLMAGLWSVATVLCAAAGNYTQLLGARFLIGFGEAAYASVGIAVILGVFSPRLYASLSGSVIGAGFFGSVVGVALGGVLADRLGWRGAFLIMAAFGLCLVVLFRIVVNEQRLARYATDQPISEAGASQGKRAPISSLLTNASLTCAYVGAGIQFFVAGVLLAWLPSYFNRYHDMSAADAGLAASVFVLLIGAGTVLCGIAADRIGRRRPERRWSAAIAYGVISMVCLMIGFQLDNGPLQMTLIGIGAFFCSGFTGATTAVVASLSHPSIQASAFGVGTLANNVFGLALGPLVIGLLSDRLGLLGALQWVPIASVFSIAVLGLGLKLYPAGLRKLASVELKKPKETSEAPADTLVSQA
ncbi:putative MFS family arabinose efflux permease [Rhodococcus sp. AG1013]|uniref:MFS transporter n=1 Tax=Rhodococcus sp. AG1013 TaxID=2183996 RepID=UPI000E0BA19D|nr:MFS transporter [Rhodococcus sp. AG1013]RDI30518.1 putative MFS family arabinose efflux permease [Rhodococcus sp. AG1013]